MLGGDKYLFQKALQISQPTRFRVAACSMEVLQIVARNLARKADPESTPLQDVWGALPGQLSFKHLLDSCKEFREEFGGEEFALAMRCSAQEVLEEIRCTEPDWFWRSPRTEGQGGMVDRIALKLGYEFRPDVLEDMRREAWQETAVDFEDIGWDSDYSNDWGGASSSRARRSKPAARSRSPRR